MAPDSKSSNPGPEPTEPHRENVPGELDHASGEVEEFEAELISGANGSTEGTPSDAELEREAREPAAKAGSGGPRFLVFLKASWAELQRVQWPDRRQVGQATAVVIGFVVIAGAYLGVADWLAQRVVDALL
jgi:preprotein translocase SecE subunit